MPNQTNTPPPASKRRSQAEMLEAAKTRKQALLDQVKKLDDTIRAKEAAQRKLAASAERKTRTRALIQLGLLAEEVLGRSDPTLVERWLASACQRQAKAKAAGNKRVAADIEILLPLLVSLADRAKAKATPPPQSPAKAS